MDNKKKAIKINRTKKIDGDALNMLKSMVSEKKAVIWKKIRRGISRMVRRTLERKEEIGARGISKIPRPVIKKVRGTNSKPAIKLAKEYRLNKNSDKGRAIREAEKLADNNSIIIGGTLSLIPCKSLAKKQGFFSSLWFFAISAANSLLGWIRHLLMKALN
jgi:hypothetical protein